MARSSATERTYPVLGVPLRAGSLGRTDARSRASLSAVTYAVTYMEPVQGMPDLREWRAFR